MPLILLGLGVDFSAHGPSPWWESVAEISGGGIKAVAHYSMLGSFTHTILDWTSVCAAGCVVILIFVQFRLTREPSLPIIGVAIACAGVMEAFHTVAAECSIQSATMDDSVFLPFTWTLSRLFNSVILMVAVGLFAFSAGPTLQRSRKSVIGISLLFVSVTGITIHICGTAETLPVGLFPGALVKRPYDILPLVPYLLCLGLIFPKYLERRRSLFGLSLLWSLIPHIAAQFYMAFGSSELYDSCFNVAHALKAVAYALPLVGLLMEYQQTYAERTRAQAAAQESETRHRTVLETLVDGLITIDEAGMIESVNPSAQRLFMYEATEILGKNIRILMPEPHHSNHDGYLENYKSTGIAHVMGATRELEGLRKDGTIFPMELSVNEMQIGNRRMYSGITRDISVRKEAETALESHAAELQSFSDRMELRNRELREAKRALEAAAISLERSNNELDAFAYIASHDLKEPLRGIHNYAMFLLEDYGGEFEEKGRSMLETLPRLTQRLETLIDSLLHFSRVGRSDLAVAETDLDKIVGEVLDTLHISLQENGIEMRIPRPLPIVLCDSVRVAEVFRNLITNAMKYNDKDAKWIEIGYMDAAESNRADEMSPGVIVFYVRDNGIGIPEKHIESVFRIFKRLHGREKFGGGTGAGLTIVKKIIERHDGRIWIESTPDEGTTFYFTLQESISHDDDVRHYAPTDFACR
jgi:PAS domain S-box-containing protein